VLVAYGVHQAGVVKKGLRYRKAGCFDITGLAFLARANGIMIYKITSLGLVIHMWRSVDGLYLSEITRSPTVPTSGVLTT